MIESRHVTCLIDTGAAYSICCEDILPEGTSLARSSIQLKRVTGTPLKVLGSFHTSIKLGNVQKPFSLLVVPNMSHKVIIGRDFLSDTGSVIDFKQLTFSIDDHQIPLMKPLNRSVRHSLIASTSSIIKPRTFGLVKCKILKSSGKKRAQSFISSTGIFSPNLQVKGSVVASDGFYNAKRGSLEVLVYNDSKSDAAIYRNARVGSFDTLSEHFINNVNSCFSIHDRRQSNSSKANPEPSINNVEGNQKERWQGDNVHRLFKLLKLDDLQHLSAEQVSKVKSLIVEFKQIFSEGEDDIGCTNMMEQTIVLDTHVPIRAKYRSIPLAHREAAEREVKRLLDLGVIQPSESPYHSPSFLLKKPDGSFRILTDFRLLNKHVIRSYQMVPSVEMMSACWKGCKYYSKMDFIKGFYQCNLAPESRKYTATCIPGVAFFEYCKSPLGLSSSPGFFQSLVERMMMGLKGSTCVCFLDDILSGSPTFEGMLANLRLIFERILASEMLLSPKKVELFKPKLKFLGVVLSQEGVSVCNEKLDAINNMLPPKNAKGIKTFLGMTGFFRKFIKDYAKLAAPLTRLLKKDAPFLWGDEQQESWKALKHALSVAPTLLHPDVHKKFTLMTDSSSYAIGSILCQRDDKGNLHPVSFASKIITEAEQKWSIVQKELFSLKYFCEKFKNFLINQDFDVIVDNSALLHLDTFKHSDNKRLWRWFETLQNYKFTVTLSPSRDNPSDGPSRLVQNNDPLIGSLPEKAEVSVDSVDETVDKAENVNKILNEDSELVPCTHDSIKQAQRSDPTLTKVIQWVESGQRPESSRELSPDEKTYFNSFSRLSIVDGLLHRSWESLKGNSTASLLCIPHSLQEKTINLCHTIPMSGHYAKEKTFAKLTSRFYFPKMQQKVALYIDNCEPCLKKARNQKTLKAPLQPFVASYPNDVLQIDIIESLPSNNGYHAILTMIDRFTRYAEAVPLRCTKVETIARVILNQYISRHGIPTAIHSDRGGQLHTADLIQAVYKLMGIEKTATTAYRPQSNGGCERFNGTLKGLLWAYCQANPKNWLNCLDQVLFAYRTSVHSATGYSPFFLRYGIHPRLPVDILTGTQPPCIENKSQRQHAHDLYYKLHDVYAFVREHLKTKQASMKRQFDRSAHSIEYKPNDWVYVWKPAPAECDFRKFYDHYRGPFKIVKKITEYTYKIALGGDKFDVVHMEKLRLARNGPKPAVVPVPNLRGLTTTSQHPDRPNDSRDDQQPCVSTETRPVQRAVRDRNPVRRLTYEQGFAQTEQ